MLYLVGLGLGDAKDITVKGLEIVKKCQRVYLEHYTSILTCSKDDLEAFYGRQVILADRDLVEQGADEILSGADEEDIALLVVGDPYGATTHLDLQLRAQERGIPTRAIHNASILNAVGACGLSLYKFGETVSIPFWDGNWEPDSFYDRILSNRKNGLHTLCLLDIKVKERSVENLMKGRDIFEPPRFMSTQQAIQQLIEIIKRRGGGENESFLESLLFDQDTICVAMARIGCDDQKMVSGTLKDLSELDMGKPLHSLIVAGDLQEFEMEAIKLLCENAMLSVFLNSIVAISSPKKN